MAHGQRVDLDEVAVLCNLSLLPRGQKRPLSFPVLGEDGRVGELDRSGLDELRSSSVVAGRAILHRFKRPAIIRLHDGGGNTSCEIGVGGSRLGGSLR